jgi:hypothetical protein
MKHSRDHAAAERTERAHDAPLGRAPRWWLVATLVPVSIVIAIATRDAVAWVDRPFAGFLFGDSGIVFSIGRPQWRLPSLRRAEWAHVTAIDGTPTAHGTDVHAAVRAAGTGSITYSFRRGSEDFRLAVPIRVFTWDDFVEVFLPLLGVGTWIVLVAAWLVYLRPDLPEVRGLFVMCVLLSLLLITGPDAYGPYRFVWVAWTALAALPPAVIHLAVSYLWRDSLVAQRIVRVLFVVFGALGITLALQRWQPAVFLPLLYFVYCASANAILLYAGALVSALVTGRRFRPQVAVALAAIVGSCATVIAVLVTYPLHTEPISAPWFIVPMGLWPVIHGFAFIRLVPPAAEVPS